MAVLEQHVDEVFIFEGLLELNDVGLFDLFHALDFSSEIVHEVGCFFEFVERDEFECVVFALLILD